MLTSSSATISLSLLPQKWSSTHNRPPVNKVSFFVHHRHVHSTKMTPSPARFSIVSEKLRQSLAINNQIPHIVFLSFFIINGCNRNITCTTPIDQVIIHSQRQTSYRQNRMLFRGGTMPSRSTKVGVGFWNNLVAFVVYDLGNIQLRTNKGKERSNRLKFLFHLVDTIISLSTTSSIRESDRSDCALSFSSYRSNFGSD